MELATLARPYAKAIFELGEANNSHAQWSQVLGVLSQAMVDVELTQWLSNPNVLPGQRFELLESLVETAIHENGRHLLHVLIDNKRLPLLPAIDEEYQVIYNERQQTIEAFVQSAEILDESQQARLTKALEERVKRHITLNCEHTPDLMGGLKIQVGDLVIDGSLRGRLERLRAELCAEHV